MWHSAGYDRFLQILCSVAIICSLSATAANASEYPHQMKLAAGGQDLTLLLKPSRVTHTLQVIDTNGSRKGAPVRTYIGKIKGDQNSWVRLTKSINKTDGVISRFGKRFRFQQTGNRPLRIQPLADNHDRRVTLTSNRSNARSNAMPPLTRVVRLAIVVDSKFNARHRGQGLEYALGLINSVDGIFREEFGIALQVETAINITDRHSDPLNFDNTTVEQMLRGFRDYRMNTRLIGNNVSMVHLFTGNTPTDEPVGLAWIDTACRTDGYDVGLSTHYRHDILLAAHELAHNLGALHDTDTSCATSSDKVMWPYISSATTQQFSSCTIASVKRSLARSCHATAADQELAMTTPRNKLQNNPLQTNTAALLAAELPDHEHDHNHNHSKRFR